MWLPLAAARGKNHRGAFWFCAASGAYCIFFAWFFCTQCWTAGTLRKKEDETEGKANVLSTEFPRLGFKPNGPTCSESYCLSGRIRVIATDAMSLKGAAYRWRRNLCLSLIETAGPTSGCICATHLLAFTTVATPLNPRDFPYVTTLPHSALVGVGFDEKMLHGLSLGCWVTPTIGGAFDRVLYY